MRESRPFGVEFEPLADSLVSKDVKGLEVAITTRLERVYQTLCELAFWSIQSALDKHDAWVVLDQVVNLAERKLLFFLKERLDECVRLLDLVC